MEKETKKYLIIGTAIVVTVGIGVILWKKYQTQTQGSDSAAATDQSNQDELSLLAASLESNAYASATGAGNFSPQVVGAGTPQSLADEVLALEHALGFGPSTSVPAAPTTPSGSSPSPTTPASPSPTAPQAPVQHAPAAQADLSEMIHYNHGMPIFAMDGVPGEGVLVS